MPSNSRDASLHAIQTGSTSQPASCPVIIGGELSLAVKTPGHNIDQSPPSSAKVKDAWIHTSISLHIFMVWCSVKHMEHFCFTLHGLSNFCAVVPSQSAQSETSHNSQFSTGYVAAETLSF
jgi:hypothetical protein